MYFLKSLLNLLPYCFGFMFIDFFFFPFGNKTCGILAPRAGIKFVPPASEGEVLTTAPPGKPLASAIRNEIVIVFTLSGSLPLIV